MTLEDRRKKHEAALAEIKAQEAKRKQKLDAQKAAAAKVPEAKRTEADALDALTAAEEAANKARDTYRKRRREREQLQVAAGQPVKPRKKATTEQPPAEVAAAPQGEASAQGGTSTP